MKFIKNAFRFLTSLYSIVLFVILVVLYVLFEFVFEIQLLSENVTWIYSSSMQTLAALIALLPISYGYYITNLDNERNENLDSYIVERLKSDVYYNMMTVIVFSLLVIILNLLSFFVSYHVNFTFIIALLTVEGIGLISRYIYTLFDPNRVREILKEYDTTTQTTDSEITISLDTFITKYLELETSVKDFISNENDNEMVDTLPLYDIVDNLSKDFPEIEEYYDAFKEIIFHRNNLIHNYTDTVVDFTKYQKMMELKDFFDKQNNMFIQKRIFTNVLAIRTTIVTLLKEYLSDMQNDQVEIGTIPDDFKEDIVSLLQSYFISEYFFTTSLEDAHDADFEVIQNNYSERKLLGIDVKSIQPRNLTAIANSYFTRLGSRFSYLFLINFNPKDKQFTILYQTKDRENRQIFVS